MSISEKIKERILADDGSFLANDNLSKYIHEGETEQLIDEVALKMQSVLESLVIDIEHDHNSHDTARRVAKLFINETFSGRYKAPPSMTEFPNSKDLDEMYIVGPIHVDSACSHHLVPIVGKLWIGIMPGEKVLGLSKFHRLSEWVMRRPQIQEEATILLANAIEKAIKPKGLGVIFTAKHMCCTWRGVHDTNSLMTTSVVRGSMRDMPHLKAEFLELVKLRP